jgi:hypothetical protein
MQDPIEPKHRWVGASGGQEAALTTAKESTEGQRRRDAGLACKGWGWGRELSLVRHRLILRSDAGCKGGPPALLTSGHAHIPLLCTLVFTYTCIYSFAHAQSLTQSLTYSHTVRWSSYASS